MLNNKNLRNVVALFVFTLMSIPAAFAAPATFTYQGRIVGADGAPLEYQSVSFEFIITNPNGSCILYREQLNNVDMRNSKGVFDTPIGTGTKAYPLTAATLIDVFDNSVASLSCEGGSTYIPSVDDYRKLRVQFFDGGGWRLITPDNIIRSVPYASFAGSALKLGSKSATDFVLKTSLPAACVAGQVITFDGASFSCVTDQGGAAGTITSVVGTSPILANTSAGVVTISASVGTAAGTLAAGNDARFTDARAPTGSATGDLLGSTYANLTIAANAITTAKINDGAVTNSKIVDGSVSSAKILDGTIGVVDLAAGTATGQVLRYSGSVWQHTKLLYTDLLNVNGVSPWPGACGTGEFLTWISGSDSFTCVAVTSSTIAAGLGYTAANAARTITAGTGLTGGGSLAADRTLAVDVGTGANQIPQLDGSGKLPSSVIPGGGGTVTSVGAGTGLTGGPITASGSLAVDVGTTAGKIVQLDVSAKLPAVDGSALTNLNSSNLSSAVPISKGGTGQTTQAAALTALLPAQTSANGKFLSSDGTSATWQSISLTLSQITTALGFTPANEARLISAGTGLTGGGSLAADRTLAVDVGTGANQIPQLDSGGKILSSVLPTTVTNGLWTESSGDIYRSTGKVGIGTTTPASPLHVVGAANSVTSGTATLSTANFNIWPGAVTSANYEGGFFGLTLGNSIAMTGSSRGVTGQVYNNNTGAVNDTRGGYLYVQNGNSGTITDAAGGYLEVQNGSTGTITRAVGARVRVANNGSGSIGTGYGLYIDNVAGTIAYGLYQADATAKNYFAGKVGIGTSAPSEALEVVGKVKATELCIGTDCKSAWPAVGGGGTVTAVTRGAGLVSGADITTTGTIDVDVGTTAGKIVQLDVSAKLPAVDGSALTNLNPTNLSAVVPVVKGGTGQSSYTDGQILIGNSTGNTLSKQVLSGDATMTNAGLVTVNGIKGKAVSGTTPLTGQMLRYDGTGWTPNFVSMFDLRSGITGTQAFGGVGCTAGQTLTWTAASDNLSCTAISITKSQISNFPTLGTAAAKDFGTAIGNLVELDGTAKIPSSLLPAGIASQWTTASSNIYYNTGNVGIGTTSPSYALSLGGNAARTIAMEAHTTASGNGNDLTIQAGAPGTNSNLDGGDLILNGGSARGNGSSAVGINVTNSTQGSGTTVRLPNSRMALFDGGARNIMLGAGAAANTGFYSMLIAVDGAQSYSMSADNALAIMGGNVGIATSSPSAQLEISGTGQLTAALTDAGARGATLQINSSNTPTVGEGGAIAFGNNQSKAAGSIGFAALKGLLTNGGTNSVGDLAISTRNAIADTALTERVRVLSTGNVGIRTSAPTEALEVNGRIKSTNTRQMASATASINTASGTASDMAGMSLTVTTGNQPIMIMVNIGACYNTAASTTATFNLLEDGVSVATNVTQFVSASDVKVVNINWLKTPTAGSHTYKVQWSTSSGTLICSWSNATRSIIVWE